MQSFLCMMALGNKTVAHTWLPSFDNENSRLCRDPEILLISLDWLSAFLQDNGTQCRHSIHILCEYGCDFCLKSKFLSAEV